MMPFHPQLYETTFYVSVAAHVPMWGSQHNMCPIATAECCKTKRPHQWADQMFCEQRSGLDVFMTQSHLLHQPAFLALCLLYQLISL